MHASNTPRGVRIIGRKIMKSTLSIAVIVCTFAALGCQVVVAGDCDHSAPREATLAAGGATRLVIDTGAGSLTVHGVDGLEEVRATGTACASRAEYLDDIRVTGERRGDTLYLKAEYPERVSGQASLDLSVELPAGLDVSIDDGSGSIEVDAVGSLEIEDGSGDIEVRSIAGDLRIKDGSGGIDVNDVRGGVDLDDGSGEIEVLGVGGSLRVDDGSGEMTLTGIGGSVRVSDGSGGFVVRDVDGDVIVEDDGSGDMEIAGVGGSVTVEEDGSGSIRIHDVEGDCTVRRDGSGGIDVDNVRGRVSLPD